MTSFRIRWCLLPGLAAILLATAGCGSGDKPLTRAEFTAKAGGSCRDASRALAKLREPRTRAQYERYVNRSGFVVQQLYDHLAALDPPKDDATTYQHFVRILDGNIKAVHKVERAVTEQRFAQLAGLENGSLSTSVLEARYARALGIPRCAGVTTLRLPKPPRPPRSAPAPGGGSSQAPPAGGGLPVQGGRVLRSQFIAGCSVQAGRALCTCVFDRLTKRYGIRTQGDWLDLIARTRQAFVTGNPGAIPAPLRNAISTCQRDVGLA